MSLHEFTFSGQQKKRIERHVVLWFLCYAYLVICYPPFTGGDPATFYKIASVRSFFHLIGQMVFCYPLLYVLIPFFFRKKRYVQFVCMVLLLWIASSAFRFIVNNYIYIPFINQLGLNEPRTPATLKLSSVLQTTTGPVFISFVFVSLKIFKDWQQKREENFNLQKENFNAELQLLKAQVHPHFLFNTLNNVYFFILSDPQEAKELIKKLEKMLYYMINECNAQVVPLNKEISMINNYVDLEKVRYADLDIEMSITGECTNQMIAPLLMIPLIENSFKHGTSKMLRNPWIKLFIQADAEMLHFTLANSKPAENKIHNVQGIGLRNVQKRLELLYAGNHYFIIEPTINTFTVNMQIPLTRKIS